MERPTYRLSTDALNDFLEHARTNRAAPTTDGAVQQVWQALLDAGVVRDASDRPLADARITVDSATIMLEAGGRQTRWDRRKALPFDPAIVLLADLLVATLSEPGETPPPGHVPKQ